MKWHAHSNSWRAGRAYTVRPAGKGFAVYRTNASVMDDGTLIGVASTLKRAKQMASDNRRENGRGAA